LWVGLLIAGLAILFFSIITWRHYQSKQEAIQIAHDFVEKALRQHNADLLSSYLADTLEYFFDKPQKTLPEIQKDYMDFWQSIQRDSIAWLDKLTATRHEDSWIISGTLYYLYTTKPRRKIEPKKRYNKLWGRYETYNEIKFIPSQTVCKTKNIQISVQSAKIISIRQLSETPCK
jgi:glycine betaine/choline ABC-type transport system substrate-binding protein